MKITGRSGGKRSVIFAGRVWRPSDLRRKELSAVFSQGLVIGPGFGIPCEKVNDRDFSDMVRKCRGTSPPPDRVKSSVPDRDERGPSEEFFFRLFENCLFGEGFDERPRSVRPGAAPNLFGRDFAGVEDGRKRNSVCSLSQTQSRTSVRAPPRRENDCPQGERFR